ncbi:hypothetical protein ACO2Q2_12170 [Dyella sp. KRB-257]|uniref:hypothetical protein n=1 Tax=Dyella sp. KRB-257 TaxID=3400915 RepID=UPI003C056590
MSRRSLPPFPLADTTPFTQWATAIGLCWLGVGLFALVLTPVPAHTLASGWSPTFWLVLAPACALLGLRLRAG